MSEQETRKADRRRSLERRILKLQERHERQKLNLDALLAAYNILGAEIQRSQEQLADVG